jgi:hypothetical protein
MVGIDGSECKKIFYDLKDGKGSALGVTESFSALGLLFPFLSGYPCAFTSKDDGLDMVGFLHSW